MTSPVVGAWVEVGGYVPLRSPHLDRIIEEFSFNKSPLTQELLIDTEIGIQLSPPHRFPLDIPIKIATIEKQKAREGRWEEGKDGSMSLSGSHRAPRAFFLFLPGPGRPTT